MSSELQRVRWLTIPLVCLLTAAFVGCPPADVPRPVEEPAVEGPMVEEPIEEPAAEGPAAEEPVAEEPAVEGPMVEEPIEEPAAEPATEEVGITTDPKGPMAQAELLIELPPKYNSPDGMCLLPNGDVIVSVPNVNDRSFPAVLLRVKPDNTYEELMKSPLHPETGKAFPFGVATDEKGDLYLADLQWFANPEDPGHNSRVLWIPMEDGKPGEPKSIIEGLVVANGVLIRNGHIYVTDTTMKPGTKPLVTGVFRFRLEEAKKETIRVTQPPEDDPHCIGTFLTHNLDVGFGADGVTMDNEGNLYVSDFADGVLYKIEFEEDGTPKPPALFAKAPFMKSADGIFFDPKREVIFVADSLANAVQMVFLDGTVRTLAQDPENDGSGGRLDQPSETLVRGDELIVCNFDFPVPGGVNTKFDPPHTISVIKLPESLRD
ncbi:MAG: hypothetical protein RBS80_16870 [Thermoguttaceae bacterium]|jgi:sugar lactone lactonase YvrE|nr:hypothetical protein [Thermoguttaceae bacterium]